MHAVVNARERDEARERQHETQRAPEKNPRDHRGGEPVRAVRRRHRAGVAATAMKFVFVIRARIDLAHRQVHVFQNAARARTIDSVLNRVRDPSIAERQHDGEHERAKSPARAALPNHRRADDQEQRKKPRTAGEERHDGVEERILQRAVDETEHGNIHPVQNGHGGS